VRLRAAEDEGVVAYVILPQHLLVEEQSEPRPTPERGPLPVRHAPEAWPTDWEDAQEPEPAIEEPLPPLTERPVAPVSLSEALPARSEFDAGIQALLDREGEPTLVEAPLPTREPAAALVGEDAVALRRRVPGATAEAIPEPIVDPPLRRDPDEVRALLSRYRSGLEAGRVWDGPADEERT
jgi:hypothetical protein